MRVGIVTIFGDNFGNKLQNYALQTLLENLGCEVNTIVVTDGKRLHRIEDKAASLKKLTPSYVRQVISSRFKNQYPYKNQRDGIKESISLGKTDIPNKLRRIRAESFNRFSIENIHIEDEVYYPGDYTYPDKYDAYICGSDQIWNPTYASTSAAYFLQFSQEPKRIAFAPSFGLSKIPEELNPLYKKWLSEIPYLSVREEKGATIIKNLIGRDVPVVPDPTLCLDSKQWEKIERKPAFSVESDYILTYFLGNEIKPYRRFIEKYAEGHQIINLFDMREPEYYAVDPAEFVWLLHHAKAMFTDSFHGTVFSLIFHRPFVVFDRIESGGTGMSSRIETLLKMTGMEGRRYRKEIKVDRISFDVADIAIAAQVQKGKEFLQSSLEAVLGAAPEVMGKETFVQPHKQDCSGCGACVNVCPVQCIMIETDQEGFWYPKIDSSKCIHCNKCRNLCADAKSVIAIDREEHAYVAYTKNTAIRQNSSSGGLFSELAGYIIDMGGVVYGAGYTEDWDVEHKAVVSKNELRELRGSKYVQSSIALCFQEIKDRLGQDELIYFSGTPCQVDSLLAFLDTDNENLITQDIICHGVPSPAVWKAYVNLKRKGERVRSISFRNKTFGWHYFSMAIETDKHRYIKRLDEDVYTRLFLENVILRPSCYFCHHKHLHRKADITVADCWGNTMGLKDDDKGISLVFANTYKGKRLIENIKSKLEVVEIPFEKASVKQEAMTKSVPYNQNREMFVALAEEQGTEKVLQEWYGWDKDLLLKRKINYLKYQVRKRIQGFYIF